MDAVLLGTLVLFGIVIYLYDRKKAQVEYYKAIFHSENERLESYKSSGIFWEENVGNDRYIVMAYIGKYLKVILYDNDGTSRVLEQEEFPQEFFVKFIEALENNGVNKYSGLKRNIQRELEKREKLYKSDDLKKSFEDGKSEGYRLAQTKYAVPLADYLIRRENGNDKELPEHVKNEQSRNENPKRITFTGR